MSQAFDRHPSVRAQHQRTADRGQPAPAAFDPAELRALALAAGADDAGLVGLGHDLLAGERPYLERALPGTSTLLGFVVRMNREAIRSPERSSANLEFHHVGDEVNGIARRIVQALEQRGIRALNPAMGFPMEMERFPGRIWTVSHKLVAEAAGLGVRGLHRNVIHPVFGSFVLLGTVLIAAEPEAGPEPGRTLDFDPCLSCKLCVAACPVGAIAADGHFDFAACYTHNYREFMGGFTDWVEQVAEAKNARDYRARVSDTEGASMWQSLSFGANYKAAYCLGVCPAGEDVLAPFLEDRGGFLSRVVKPLQEKVEPVYVQPGSDAEAFVTRRFPHKPPRHVGNGLRPTSIETFLGGLPHVFQRGRAGDLDATFHFTFTGDGAAESEVEATVTIRASTIRVEAGHHGVPDLRVHADSAAWVRFLRKDVSVPRLLLTRKLRLRGPARLLLAFGRCFP
jgi:Fe-S-cluster-containing hydrogenase component 2